MRFWNFLGGLSQSIITKGLYIGGTRESFSFVGVACYDTAMEKSLHAT